MRTRFIAITLIFCITGSVPAADETTVDSIADIESSIARATAWLLENQNENGAWGGSHTPAIGFDEFWSNPETHRAWTIATTGLACMALQELEPTDAIGTAYDRATDFFIATGLVRRPSSWDTDNTWALVYGTRALARIVKDNRYAGTPKHEQLKALAAAYLAKLFTYQTPAGGWGYYDFEAHARRPAWATSFMTSSAVLAMLDARAAGLDVPKANFDGAIAALTRCRLPNGAYAYSVTAIPNPGGAGRINRVKGSLSRIQAGNLALFEAVQGVSIDDLRTGLDQFFEHHRFLDIARKKPVPHEAYYQNSGYFYFYGHFYAAGVIQHLPTEDQAPYWQKLCREIIKTQEDDGSMWDYYMNSYHRPYGVAYSLMALRSALNSGTLAKTTTP